MTSFTLKIIAIFSMLCDHMGDSILGSFSILNCIGRLAFPIFAFQITQGYLHTKNLKGYFIRLITFASASQFPFSLFLSSCGFDQSLNIFFTLFLGLLAIFAYDKISNLKIPGTKTTSKSTMVILAFFVVFGIASLGDLLNVDYGMYGILVIFSFFLFRNKKWAMCFSFIVLTLLNYIPYILRSPSHWSIYFAWIVCTCLSLVFICFYNGKQGPKCQYLFYTFYPLHLVLLSFL